VKVCHLSGGGQQLQHIAAAPGHYGQLGQVGSGLLHLHHAGDEFCPGRGLGKIVAGTHHCDSGGMCLLHQLGQVCPGGEELDVQQVGAVGVEDQMQKGKVFRMGERLLAALCLGTEGHQQKLVPQGDPQFLYAAGNGSGGLKALEPVCPPFHTIGRQR